MADRWAVATGNWSNTATWDGGTLPDVADDVYADGFTVTVDQDITVVKISTETRSGGTAGGGFTASTTRTINANIVCGTTTCLTWSGGASAEVLNVNGSIYGSTTTTTTYALQITTSGSTVNVTGDVYGGSGNVARYGIYVNNSIVVTLNITGIVYGCTPTASTGRAIGINGPTALTIIGDVKGDAPSSRTGACLCFISTSANPINVNIEGNVTGGSQTPAVIDVTLYSGSTGSIVIVGNVGPHTNQRCVHLSGAVTLTVTGNVYGSTTSSTASSISAYGVNTGIINGDLYGHFSSAVEGFSSGVTVNGDVWAAQAGGSAAGADGLILNIVVNGNVYGGDGVTVNPVRGIVTTGNAKVVVNGNLVAGPIGAAVEMTGSAQAHLRINGNAYAHPNGMFPFAVTFRGKVSMVGPTSRIVAIAEAGAVLPDVTSTVFPLYGLTAANLPAAEDVEDGVLFGPSNAYEGTLAAGGGRQTSIKMVGS